MELFRGDNITFASIFFIYTWIVHKKYVLYISLPTVFNFKNWISCFWSLSCRYYFKEVNSLLTSSVEVMYNSTYMKWSFSLPWILRNQCYTSNLTLILFFAKKLCRPNNNTKYFATKRIIENLTPHKMLTNT